MFCSLFLIKNVSDKIYSVISKAISFASPSLVLDEAWSSVAAAKEEVIIFIRLF